MKSKIRRLLAIILVIAMLAANGLVASGEGSASDSCAHTPKASDDDDGVSFSFTTVTTTTGEETTQTVTANAYYTCSICGEEQKVPADIVELEDKYVEPTCTEVGYEVYGAECEINDVTYTSTDKENYMVQVDALGHTVASAEDIDFQWGNDETEGRVCTAVFDCSECDETDIDEKCDVTYDETTEVYTATVTLRDKEYSETIPADCSHDTPAGEVTFVWYDKDKNELTKEDGKVPAKATASYTCDVCDEREVTVACTITNTETEATCEEDGEIVYTAAALIGETTYSDTKSVVIEKTGHKVPATAEGEDDAVSFTFTTTTTTTGENTTKTVTATASYTCATCGEPQEVPAELVELETKAATCTEDGYTKYGAKCEINGETYEYNTTDHKPYTVIESATGHSTPAADDVVFTWTDEEGNLLTDENGNVQATAYYTCAACNEEISVDCETTMDETAATCEEDGKIVYTATATIDGTDYTDTKTEVIPATGHKVPATAEGEDDAVSFTFETKSSTNEDGTETQTVVATASYVCDNCGEPQTVDATVSESDAVAPTCTEAGYTMYTASCEIDGVTYESSEEEAYRVEVEPAGHSFGEWTEVEAPTTTETGLEERTCSECGETESRTIPKVSISFSDVKDTDWFAPFVYEAVDRGLMVGMGDNKFCPYDTTSRAMIVQILYNMNGNPPVTGSNPFTDVPEDAWYYDAVQWAYENQVTSGISATSFAPNAAVTREQMAMFLYSYVGRPEVSGDLSGFEDPDKVSDWAKDAVIWAVQSGIISGSAEGDKLYLDPQGNATRAQTATMMVQFAKYMEQ